jgi:hypothetical protein
METIAVFVVVIYLGISVVLSNLVTECAQDYE